MKKIYTVIAGLMLTASVFAQAPEKMSYQAVIRNASNTLVTSQGVGMQISILEAGATGNAVYVETQSPTTNANGLVSLEIGTGTVVSGNFTTIDWANNTYFIKTETDPTTAGGTTYTITGTNQLMSVPYALHAKTAETITGTVSFTEIDGSITNELQTLSFANDSILLSDGLGVPFSDVNYWSKNGLGDLFTPKKVGFNLNTPAYPLDIFWNGQSGPESATRSLHLTTIAQNIGGSYLNNGIFSELNTDNAPGRSIWGTASGTNFGIGVVGESDNRALGYGVSGYSLSATGYNNNKIGVYGWARGAWDGSGAGTGDHIGVQGIAEGAGQNIGFFSVAKSLVGNTNYQFGMKGTVDGLGTGPQIGVWGEIGVNLGGVPPGTHYGVVGMSKKSNTVNANTGVYGYADNSTIANYGIDGTSAGSIGDSYGTTGWAFGTSGVGTNYAMYAQSGTGEATNYAGYFNGDVHVVGIFTNPSDRKLKTNIIEVESALANLKKLPVKQYLYKTDLGMNLPKGKQFGFIAQDVELVYPNLVKKEVAPIYEIKETTTEDGKKVITKTKTGEIEYNAVNYISFIPLLTKAIQEQQEMIEQLIKENQELRKLIEDK